MVSSSGVDKVMLDKLYSTRPSHIASLATAGTQLDFAGYTHMLIQDAHGFCILEPHISKMIPCIPICTAVSADYKPSHLLQYSGYACDWGVH